jgi:hypothetical protein
MWWKLLSIGFLILVATRSFQPHCTQYSFAYGEWVQRDNGAFTWPESPLCMDIKSSHRCDLRKGDELLRAKRIESWQWNPHCKESQISDFAESIKRKKLHKIVFVGDSLTSQHYRNFLCAVGTTYQKQTVIPISKAYPNHTMLVKSTDKDERYQAWYVRSDFLVHYLNDSLRYTPFLPSDNQPAAEVDSKIHYNANWTPFVEDADLVIVSTGPHHPPLTDEYRTVIEHVSNHLITTLKPSARIMFRTSTSGHANCGNITIPLPHSESIKLQTLYNWSSLSLFNDIIQQVIQKYPRIKLLDVSGYSNLRADAHSLGNAQDCLHYCEPGVPSVWVRHLFHAL